MGRPFPQGVQTYPYEYTDNRAATDCDGGNIDQRRVAFNELLRKGFIGLRRPKLKSKLLI